MALTITRVKGSEFTAGRIRGACFDIQFDTSYLTTGEVLSPDDVGLVLILGAIPVAVQTAAGAAATTIVYPIYNPVTGTLQAYETGDTVSTPFDEVGSTENVSAVLYRMLIIGL